MLVTAKLSKKFYEKLGDDVANELVDWLNQMDAVYRSEFRDLFELNFAKFDAKLEQRLAEVKAELQTEVRTGLGALESRMNAFEGRMLGFEGRMEGRIGALEGRLVKWMFLFWATTLGALIALQKL